MTRYHKGLLALCVFLACDALLGMLATTLGIRCAWWLSSVHALASGAALGFLSREWVWSRRDARRTARADLH